MMIGDVEMTTYVTEDSLNIEQDNEGIKNEENVNFEEKVCKELNEMRVLDIQPEELSKLRSLECWYDNGDEVRERSGIEGEMYENGTGMVDDWVVIINNTNHSSSKKVGSGKSNFFF